MNEFVSLIVYMSLALFSFSYEYFAYGEKYEISDTFVWAMDWLKWVIVFFICGNLVVICVRW